MQQVRADEILRRRGCSQTEKTLIRNATILDGTGKAPFSGDMLIDGARIAQVGGSIACESAAVIDAQGLMAAPGLIDAHAHNELQLMRDPQHACALTQGITTEIVGQCGLGAAPLSDENRANMIRMYAGILGAYEQAVHTWNSFGAFHKQLGGAAVHVACPVSHSALRANTMGFASGIADAKQRAQMAADAARAMEEGAVGFSTGLTYYPAGYSDTQELIAICRAIREKDGVFLVHKRDNFAVPRDVGDDEIVRVIRETGVRTHMLHYKTGFDNAGNMPALLSPYAPLLEQGYDISFEFYPYQVGAGFGIVFLPPWVMEGGYDAILERLRNPALRGRIEADTRVRYPYLMPSAGATFAALKRTPEYEGKSFDEVCALREQEPVPMLLDLLAENELELGYHYNLPPPSQALNALENDFFSMLDLPNYTIGSDSIAYGSHPHPRSYGTFTKMLRLAREKGYPIEKLIYKMTGYTASRYRLASKGVLAPGMDADVCLFDAGVVGERATFAHPRQTSQGIRLVLVDGKTALEHDRVTGLCAGRALKPGK